MAEAIADCGRGTLDYVPTCRVKVEARGLERVPRGRLVVICNHRRASPTGWRWYQALKRVRDDRSSTPTPTRSGLARLDEVIIPVEGWRPSARASARAGPGRDPRRSGRPRHRGLPGRPHRPPRALGLLTTDLDADRAVAGAPARSAGAAGPRPGRGRRCSTVQSLLAELRDITCSTSAEQARRSVCLTWGGRSRQRRSRRRRGRDLALKHYIERVLARRRRRGVNPAPRHFDRISAAATRKASTTGTTTRWSPSEMVSATSRNGAAKAVARPATPNRPNQGLLAGGVSRASRSAARTRGPEN